MDHQFEQPNDVQNVQINSNMCATLTVGQWIITLLLMAIPIVNIILLFIWAFDSDTNPTKKNFAKAYLIIIAIGFVISILAAILILIIGVSAFSSIHYYNVILF